MTKITITIDGPKFTMRAETEPPKVGVVHDDESIRNMQVEAWLTEQFATRIRDMANNVKLELHRLAKQAAKHREPTPDSPASTPESRGLPPSA